MSKYNEGIQRLQDFRFLGQGGPLVQREAASDLAQQADKEIDALHQRLRNAESWLNRAVDAVRNEGILENRVQCLNWEKIQATALREQLVATVFPANHAVSNEYLVSTVQQLVEDAANYRHLRDHADKLSSGPRIIAGPYRQTGYTDPRQVDEECARYREQHKLCLISQAREFATTKHIDHKRKYTGAPYTDHLAAVANTVQSVPHTPEMVAAAWLHDTVEDTNTAFAEIREHFGNTIANLVEMLTDVSIPADGNRAARKKKDREHLAQACPEAQTIKLADMLDNLHDIQNHDPMFAETYTAEMRLLLPLLRRGDQTLYKQAEVLLNGNRPNSIIGRDWVKLSVSLPPENEFLLLRVKGKGVYLTALVRVGGYFYAARSKGSSYVDVRPQYSLHNLFNSAEWMYLPGETAR
jgi:hypothetical protein